MHLAHPLKGFVASDREIARSSLWINLAFKFRNSFISFFALSKAFLPFQDCPSATRRRAAPRQGDIQSDVANPIQDIAYDRRLSTRCCNGQVNADIQTAHYR